MFAATNIFTYRGYIYDIETGFYYLGSRYYDPNTGRFLNADGITDGGAGVLGNNLYLYSANNPINNIDPSGNAVVRVDFKSGLQWFAKNIAKPAIDLVRNQLSKINLTYSRGYNLSLSPSVFSWNAQGGISIDTEGNVALQGSLGGGVTGGTPSASITTYKTVTNAPRIFDLNGEGAQIGGSCLIPIEGIPVVAGADLNLIPNPRDKKMYVGLTKSAGVGLGSPGGEFHVEWGETATMPYSSFNVFKVADEIYVRIMEW